MANDHSSIWEIKEAIKNEKLKTENMSKSADQWGLIGEEITSDVSNMTTSGHEWQIRYDCQHLYNRMLMSQVKRMRAELRMLRHSGEIAYLPEVDNSTVGEWRNQLKRLQVEKWSLKSLRRMYERQIDAESMEYFRARDQLIQLTKDVKNCRQAWIRAQEKIDEEMLTFAELRGKRRHLKPVAKITPIVTTRSGKNEGSGYSQRFERSSSKSRQRTSFSGLGLKD